MSLSFLIASKFDEQIIFVFVSFDVYESKLLTSHFYTGELTVVILEACSCSTNDPDIANLVIH